MARLTTSSAMMRSTRAYFNQKPQAVDALRYNQYGGAFGGPIRKGTTAFGNYEEYRYLDENTVIASVPTDEWRQGNFSHLYSSTGKLIPIYDPATTEPNSSGNGYVRQAFQGNSIPSGRIDSVAQAVNAFYPEPNCTPSNQYTQANNYCGPGENTRWMRQLMVRADHLFSDRHTIFARYSYYKAYTDSGASANGGVYSKIEPADYTFGNVPRALPNVRGPSALNSDISLFKTTEATENMKLEFRVEAFNAFNHPTLNLPNTSFSAGSNGLNQSGTFGTISSATDGRELQLALKLLF